MKRLFIILMMVVGAGFIAHAADSGIFVDTVPTKKKELPREPDPRRPGAPSRVYMECTYGRGFIHLAIPEGSYYVTIHLYNGAVDWTGMVTTEQPLVELPEEMVGLFTIVCRTDDGRVYSGTLDF